MTRRSARLVPGLIATVVGASVAARPFPPESVDTAPVLAAAAKAWPFTAAPVPWPVIQ
jgi:hypothetical protein